MRTAFNQIGLSTTAARPMTDFGDPATKSAVRNLLKRCRLNVADIERMLLENDWDWVQQYANDLAGAASQIADVAEANLRHRSTANRK